MAEPTIDVVGIGNAIVDVLVHGDDAFLLKHKLDRGAMTLLDTDQSDALYAAVGPGVEVSGGSAANTLAAFAACGGRSAFIGKVCDDQLGEVFGRDIREAGVAFDCPAAVDGPPTARCVIVVTPDAQRTMGTYLGACVELGPDDVDEALIASAGITYLEGYLWDPPGAKEAFRKAYRVAHENGRKVALSLSDPFCVDRHREEFLGLVNDHVDVLFANEVEIASLYRTSSFEDAIEQVRSSCEVAALTRSEQGSVIVCGDQTHVIDAVSVDNVIDSTGAGDIYAAGFLFGLSQGWELPRCAELGSATAAGVISHMGARPEADLAALVAEKFS